MDTPANHSAVLLIPQHLLIEFQETQCCQTVGKIPQQGENWPPWGKKGETQKRGKLRGKWKFVGFFMGFYKSPSKTWFYSHYL